MTQTLTIKLFTGAPEANSLRWDNEALTAPLLPCFATRYLPLEQQSLPQSTPRPAWRSLPVHNALVPADAINPSKVPHTTASTAEPSINNSSTSLPSTHNLSFPSTTSSSNDTSPSAEPNDLLTQFYEHSFALHEDVPSSQLLSPHSSASTSFLTTTTTSSSPSVSHTEPPTQTPQPAPNPLPLTLLRALPPASHILALHPQTPTVNLLICILSLPPARLIHPRRGGPPLHLTEILVADDTRAGFGLNVWLPAASEARSPGLRAAVGALRPRDVVLARNVALSAFRGVVYGQSLRRDTTRLELMYRSGGGGVYSARDLADGAVKGGVVERVRVVRQWAMDFVGGGRTDGDCDGGSKRKVEPATLMLPPDTQ
ncbi:hypothetical protein MMC11_001036 [Xylographa trunciseda]|nr:hypothetical protein [Xylographa trunciseda]